MASTSTILYPDTLLHEVLQRHVEGADRGIEIATFEWKTSYATPNAATAMQDAVIEAVQTRHVPGFVVLNFSQYEPDVAIENYRTGLRLAEAGVQVRMGPKNTTYHGKLAIIDYSTVFIGSHNLTRGGLSFNRELTVMFRTLTMARRAIAYFNILWVNSVPIADVTAPSGSGGAVQISLAGVTTVGNQIRLSYDVNHAEGVEAFAAVADDNPSLEGARIGETVSPTQRAASVLPEANAGDTVYLAVQAYRDGQAIATSRVLEKTYLPEGTPPGGGDDDGGGDDTPPPPPLVAPTLSSVTQTAETTVRLTWEWVGNPTFDRFEFQQRDLQGNWHLIGTTMQADAREWTGTPVAISDALPFRVAVYDTAAQSAASNMMYLQAAPPPPEPLTAPVLASVVAGLNGTEITVTWTFPGCENFARFEVQKQVSSEWSVVGSTLDPSVRQWVGPGPGTIEPTTYRVVVFNMAEESAASNEITITGEPPVPLQAPVVVSVTQIGPMGINVEYSHVTPAEFTRYEVQQRTNETWNTLATITTPETRSWSGGPIPYMDADHPVRVVVFVQSGDSAASDEMAITPM